MDKPEGDQDVSSGFNCLTRLGTLNCRLSEQDVGTYDGRQCVSTSQLDSRAGSRRR